MRTDQLSKLLGRPVEVAPVPFTGRYPQRMLTWEIVKACAGVAICGGMVLLLRPTPWIGWPLVGAAALFAAYLYQQATRVPLRYTVDDTGVTRIKGAQRTPLRWSELKDVRLAYYPNGRKATMGTMVLVLRNGKTRFKMDSSLDHFPALLSRAAQAARERELALHPTTQANLEQLEL
ncbi:MAG TPA: hypothetical protein VKB51_09740 [bacterium]|nr:hypothetical protein [bacterium]